MNTILWMAMKFSSKSRASHSERQVRASRLLPCRRNVEKRRVRNRHHLCFLIPARWHIMKISKLALAGFLAYASFTAVAFLYLFLSGRADAVGVHLRPIAVVVATVFFSLFIGALGAVIGMGFSLFHRLTPRSNLYLSGSA